MNLLQLALKEAPALLGLDLSGVLRFRSGAGKHEFMLAAVPLFLEVVPGLEAGP